MGCEQILYCSWCTTNAESLGTRRTSHQYEILHSIPLNNQYTVPLHISPYALVKKDIYEWGLWTEIQEVLFIFHSIAIV